MSAIKLIGEIVSRAIHTKEKWDRSDYIGASEITKCPLDLYWSKSEDDGFRGNGKTERGHAIEALEWPADTELNGKWMEKLTDEELDILENAVGLVA